jgi:hypothetical protein
MHIRDWISAYVNGWRLATSLEVNHTGHLIGIENSNSNGEFTETIERLCTA